MKKKKMTFSFWTNENDWMICNDFTVEVSEFKEIFFTQLNEIVT